LDPVGRTRRIVSGRRVTRAGGWRRPSLESRREVQPEGAALLPPIKPRAVVTFAALMLLLLAQVPLYGRVFGVAFCGYANGVARVLGGGEASEQRFSVEDPAATDPTAPRFRTDEWTVFLSRRGLEGMSPSAPIDTRIIGYTPLAVLLALVFATPLARRRRLIVLGVGLALVLARLALAIALPVGRFSTVTWQVLINPPAVSYALPLVAWLVGLTLTTDKQSISTNAKGAY
jgi:hypothetical protein